MYSLKAIKLPKEIYVFYGLLLVNILFLFCSHFYPSMDSAIHLHSTELLYQLLFTNNEIYKDFFTLNGLFIPNWTFQIILTFLNSFLPAWAAEKLLLIFYFTAISISFRLLIKKLCPSENYLTVIIFPFAHSFLFHLGFYNYSLSFIFFYFSIYLYLKILESPNIKNYLFLSLFILFTYISAVLTFAFLGFILFLITIAYKIDIIGDIKRFFKNVFSSLFLLFIVSVPSLILFYFFLQKIEFFNSDQIINYQELIKWIYDIRVLIVYNYNSDAGILRLILVAFLLIIGFSLYKFLKEKKYKNWTNILKSEFILISFLLAVYLYFTTPDNSGAGMMSQRYLLIMFMIFIIWIASRNIGKVFSFVMAILIIVSHLTLLIKQSSVIEDLNKNAVIVKNEAEYIKEHSVVLPINLSDNWLEIHFSDYLGIDKPLIVLDNCEADVGWYPLKWNFEKLPNLKIGNLSNVAGLIWASNIKNQVKPIDYVYIYGNLNKLNEEKWSELKVVLEQDYKLVKTNNSDYNILFKLKNQ